MSLQDLATLRMGGNSPKLVWLIVGDCPRYIDPSFDMIRITPADKPALMDFRSLVMLDVTIYEIGKYASLFKQTIKAVEAAKPATLSLACRAGVAGVSDQHEEILKTVYRSLLWRQ